MDVMGLVWITALHVNNCMYGYYKFKNPPYWAVLVIETAASLRSWNSLLALGKETWKITKYLKKKTVILRKEIRARIFFSPEFEVWMLFIYAVRSGIINSTFTTVMSSLFRYQPSPCRVCGGQIAIGANSLWVW